MFNRPPPVIKKGREFNSLPFFLSDEFKAIIEEKHRPLVTGPSDKKETTGTLNLGTIS